MSGYGFSVGSSGYDDEARLVNWERTDTNLDQSWNLSAVGNWNSITENSSTQNRTHGPTHEMLTVASQSVTHDAKGNMTLIPAVLRPTNSGLPPTASRLSWDFENKLIAADTDNDSTDDIFYKFDALGRRVGRDDGTANVVYFQDGPQTIADYPSGTAAGSPTYTYVYASYIDEPVMRGGSGGLRYYHRNQQYSITAVSDGGGSVIERYAYSAYGEVTIADGTGSEISNSTISNRYTYTGREWDEGLSLYHYRARMYDAVVERFVSRDPAGYSDGTLSYGNNFVLDGTDPTGMVRWPFSKKSRTLKLCLRWQYWEYPYFDCMTEPSRSQEILADYVRWRDSAIRTYRESIQRLKDGVKACCDKFNINCDLSLDYDFKLKPILLRPRTDPIRGAMTINCSGGLSVLITTNHYFPDGFETTHGQTPNKGVPFIWIGTDGPSGPYTTLSHECGHCGGYGAPPGMASPRGQNPGTHHSDPKNVMHNVAGTEIDQNWCQAISSLADTL